MSCRFGFVQQPGCILAGWKFDRFFGEPVETVTKSPTREFTGSLAEEIKLVLAFSAVFPSNFAASLVLRESSEAPRSVVTATAGSVHGATTLSSPIVGQPASIQPGCILAGWTYAIPRLRFDLGHLAEGRLPAKAWRSRGPGTTTGRADVGCAVSAAAKYLAA